jgi:hypothetical protein
VTGRGMSVADSRALIRAAGLPGFRAVDPGAAIEARGVQSAPVAGPPAAGASVNLAPGAVAVADGLQAAIDGLRAGSLSAVDFKRRVGALANMGGY